MRQSSELPFNCDLQDTGDCKVINAAGAYVMPGGIDPHTHLEMPFMGTTAVDDFFTYALHDLHKALADTICMADAEVQAPAVL